MNPVVVVVVAVAAAVAVAVAVAAAGLQHLVAGRDTPEALE